MVRKLGISKGAFLWMLFCGTALGVTLAMAAGCGNTSVQFNSNPPRGTLSVSISDPPSCKFPNGTFKNVHVTVRSVQAHLSSAASDSAPGWQELAPQLASQPVQIDLLATPQGGCTLAMLGSNISLPVGNYQQIRLILLDNNPPAGQPTPATNACGSQGFNCVILSDNSIHMLNLSSQSNTGLKIPPGQIVGGPIRVSDGQHTDINIDFNTCASILLQGNGQYRLKPTLTAGQVSTVNSGLSGRVIDSITLQPIVGGQVLVAIEQPDSSGVERIIMQAAADANGNFNFCPLPTGTYDVVAVAIDGAGVAYGASVVFNVPAGTTLGAIPLLANASAPNGPGTIQGVVTASTGSAGAAVDVVLSALQTVQLSGGVTRQVTLPLQGSSAPAVTTSATPMGVTCPANTFCAQYSLILPSTNLRFASFVMGGFTFSIPAAGDVLYTIEARSFVAGSGSTPICSNSPLTTNQDSTSQPLKVTAGATTTAKQLDLTACV
jgi:hypothetical protein